MSCVGVYGQEVRRRCQLASTRDDDLHHLSVGSHACVGTNQCSQFVMRMVTRGGECGLVVMAVQMTGDDKAEV